MGVVDYTALAPSFGTPVLVWVPKVRYHYTVAGQEYHNDIINVCDGPRPRTADCWTICLGTWEGNRLERSRRQLTEKYPVNGQVAVYYNPASPSDACLERVDYLLLLLSLLVSLLFIGSGVCFVLRAKRPVSSARVEPRTPTG